uniref:Uncharacterized protein n=1 Tax=Panagrolaimus superbus TaxID=310955 RepID=A0A914YZS6_9BILA
MTWSTKQKPPVMTTISIPAYGIKTLGSRHILVGGGGGAAATGVKNELQLYLLTYNQFAKIEGGKYKHLIGKKTATVDTGLRATMNMDAVSIGPPDSGRYLIAAGQDDLCVFYETSGFDLAPVDSDVDSPSQLSLRFQELNKVKSTEAASKSYQLCVRFDRSPSKPLRVATGGTDGYVRIWDAIGFCQNRVRS